MLSWKTWARCYTHRTSSREVTRLPFSFIFSTACTWVCVSRTCQDLAILHMVYSYSTTELAKPTAYRHIQSLRDGLFETWTRWLIQPLGWAFLRNACSCLHWKHGGSTTMGGPTHPLTYKLRHSKDIQRTLSALTPSFSPLAIIWVTTPYEEQAWG